MQEIGIDHIQWKVLPWQMESGCSKRSINMETLFSCRICGKGYIRYHYCYKHEQACITKNMEVQRIDIIRQVKLIRRYSQREIYDVVPPVRKEEVTANKLRFERIKYMSGVYSRWSIVE